MDQNFWEYQQKAIDDQIKSLEDTIHIHALKHRRNALAPISSVPAEVMVAIFFHLRSGKPNIHVVLGVTHVCHRWREIALDHPLLWTHIHFDTITPAGATKILARAGMAPLYLEAEVYSDHWSNSRFLPFQKELQTHISHIYHLRIRADHSHLDETLKGLISPAPTLEYLLLAAEDPLHVSVPDTLFDGATPKLSSLHLGNCDISWKSPLLKGLTNLEVTSMPTSARPGLTDWLDALDNMPQLEWLSLDSASPSAHDFPLDVDRTVTLPLLAELDISDSAVDCSLMLAHLILPALTSLSITTTSDHPTIEKLLPYVVQHAHGPQDAQPLQSALIHSDNIRVGVVAWLAPNSGLLEWHTEFTARVSLSITSDINDLRDRYGIVEAAMAALPLGGLVTLTTPCTTGACDETFWYNYMPRWPLLTHAHLANLPGSGFRRVLLQDGSRGDSEGPLLPLLTNLELIDVELTDLRVGQLCDLLLNRVKQGVPLQVLDLRTCYATSVVKSRAIVRKLREIVVDVCAPTTRMPYYSSDDDSDGDDSESSDPSQSDGDNDLGGDNDPDGDGDDSMNDSLQSRYGTYLWKF